MKDIVPTIELNKNLFLNKLTNIIGASGSGKSTIVKDIISILHPHISQVNVVCADDKSYAEFMEPEFIHNELTNEFLESLLERQMKNTEISNKVNNISILEKLFKRLELKDENYFVEIMKEQYLIFNNKFDDHFNLLLGSIYKKYIKEYRDHIDHAGFNKEKLTPEEIECILHIHINPHVLIIFDNMTPDFKKLQNNPNLSKLFYQCRHNNISILNVVHAHNILPPALRTSANNHIFTDEFNSTGYFNSTANNISQEQQLMAKFASDEVFKNGSPYQKVLFDQSLNKYFKFTAKI